MTYFIETEHDGKSNKQRKTILVRSIIRTRRKNIGTKDEHGKHRSRINRFFQSQQDLETNKGEMLITDATSTIVNADKSQLAPSGHQSDLGEEQDPSEALPPGLLSKYLSNNNICHYISILNSLNDIPTNGMNFSQTSFPAAFDLFRFHFDN
jgi:hypothetical protein